MGAWTFPAPKSAECMLAAALARGREVVAGFGASDCRCGGHLLRFARRSEVEEAVRSAARGRGGQEGWNRRTDPVDGAQGVWVRFLGKRELTALGVAL